MNEATKKSAKPIYALKSVGELAANPQNARTHSAKQVDKIAKSIEKFGFINPVVTDSAGVLIAGHGRLEAANKLGLKEIPCILADHLSAAEKKAYMLADNQIATESGWDGDLLKIALEELRAEDFDLAFTGFDQKDIDAIFAPVSVDTGKSGSLAESFLIPPFSVLNAREGWWQDRKRAWLAKGIRSEIGRGDNLLQMSDAAKLGGGYGKKSKFGKCLETGIGEKYGREEQTGTSIFDPVLCELAYIWFSPQGGNVLDPFSGGSVRGVVASILGRNYLGVDLRAEQIEANLAQGQELCAAENMPRWICGDSRETDTHAAGFEADFLFSCPPYADLEVYSDDPSDLSTLAYKDFKAAYFNIIAKSCALLKDNRFACFVVGEVRGKDGAYYDFVGDTVEAFRAAGLSYYNEIILVTAIGSLPIRAGKQFKSSRKVGKTHQNVLVFCKGDGKKAAAACGKVAVYLPDATDAGDGQP